MNYDIVTAHEKATKVEGWLTKAEGETLYKLAAQTKKRGAIVEIGSWQGKSTIYIGSALKAANNNERFYAVDPHIGSDEHKVDGRNVWTYDAFMKNIQSAGILDVVVPVVKSSADFSNEVHEPVDFIFIDGAHDYDNVEKDFLSWYPKVQEGGVMAFHDTYAGGEPYDVLKKYLYPSRAFGRIRRVDSITYVTKVSRNSLGTCAYNRLNQLWQDFKIRMYKWGGVNKIIVLIKKNSVWLKASHV